MESFLQNLQQCLGAGLVALGLVVIASGVARRCSLWRTWCVCAAGAFVACIGAAASMSFTGLWQPAGDAVALLGLTVASTGIFNVRLDRRVLATVAGGIWVCFMGLAVLRAQPVDQEWSEVEQPCAVFASRSE